MHFKTIVAFLMLGVQALALPEAEPQRETTTSTTRTGTTTTRTSTTSTSCPTATAIPASLQVITYRQIRCGSNQVNRQGDKPNANQEFVRITSRNSDCRDIETGRQGLDSVSFEVQGTLPANRDCVMQWFTERGCDRGRSRTEFRLTDQNRCFNTRGIRSFRTVCRRRRSD
ncbi:unnamed protein product [Zymoseptoria tritici ST99CH_3D7]|uniref:Ig-like domain-containing protein n=1 Tax=Zymoseptoria tritici (strain ST99CH_3D7) TaxID=1276538 RepID=A0A1X7RGQ2_ZYMT9|nr:unnamed protein product [Zymoseptoria tritici ST99CH_3D7]